MLMFKETNISYQNLTQLINYLCTVVGNVIRPYVIFLSSITARINSHSLKVHSTSHLNKKVHMNPLAKYLTLVCSTSRDGYYYIGSQVSGGEIPFILHSV